MARMYIEFEEGQTVHISPKSGKHMTAKVLSFVPHDGGIGRPCSELKVECLENTPIGRKPYKTYAQRGNEYTFLYDIFFGEPPNKRSWWWTKKWPRVRISIADQGGDEKQTP